MKTIPTLSYLNKHNCGQYPLYLYWFCHLRILPVSSLIDQYIELYNNPSGDWMAFLEDALNPEINQDPLTVARPIQVLIPDSNSSVRVSVPPMTGEESNNNQAMTLLYAIDLMKYPDGQFYDKEDANAYFRDTSNISVILAYQPDETTKLNTELIKTVTNIIDTGLNTPACDYHTVTTDSMESMHATHYMSSVIGRATFSAVKYFTEDSYDNDQVLIDAVSGLEQARDKTGADRPQDLHGSLTIKSNRIIEL